MAKWTATEILGAMEVDLARPGRVKWLAAWMLENVQEVLPRPLHSPPYVDIKLRSRGVAAASELAQGWAAELGIEIVEGICSFRFDAENVMVFVDTRFRPDLEVRDTTIVPPGVHQPCVDHWDR